MSSKLRNSSGTSRKQLKGKVVQIYETFLRNEDPSLQCNNLWDEFFLMKPKLNVLEAELSKLTVEQLMGLKDVLNKLVSQAIHTLKDEHHLKAYNALQTLCVILKVIFKKLQSGHSFDVINVLMGFKNAEALMQSLLDSSSKFITDEYAMNIKNLSLKLLLTLLTGIDNVSQNTLLECLMTNCIYEAMIQVLSDANARASLGYDAVLVLTLLVNYRKYESANPFILNLSILDDELCLNGFGQVVATSLSDFNKRYSAQFLEPQGSGLFSTLTSMVGSIFISEEEEVRTKNIKSNETLLLALYEAVHLNRNFITILVQSQTDATRMALSCNPVEITNGSTPNLASIETIQPTILLVTFLEYCSIVMQNTRSEDSCNTVKLCFLTLTCICEDQYANSLMHDQNLVFKVHLHKVPMRHRKIALDKVSSPRSLACALLDLTVEFILSHMMKKLPLELYKFCFGIIHRLLVYQKKSRIRLSYPWKEMWSALISFLKFLYSNEASLTKKLNIFVLAQQVVNIFNLFITFGDTFLSLPTSYDELYYELIRMNQVFDNFYSLALRHSTSHGEWKDSAGKLTINLANIRAITNHFNPKIETLTNELGGSNLTEEQVLQVVKENYDGLTLKLQDTLDQYERYSEKPHHAAFFSAMVRSVITVTRNSITFEDCRIND